MSYLNASRRNVLAGMLGTLAASQVSAKVVGEGKKPNIVFFLGEGLRSDEFSFTGNPLLKTPNMDRIAKEGAWFSNAFVTNALCLPSRASFLTGAYSHRTGAVSNDESFVPKDFPMICDLLQEAGYETAFVGKSHIGGALLEHHWDFYFGFKGQADYYRPTIIEGHNGTYLPEKTFEGYVDDILTDKTSEWLENRKSDKPFVLFFWFYAPHAPFYRPKRMVNDLNGVPIPIPSTFKEEAEGYPGKPAAVRDADNKVGTAEVFMDDPRSVEELVKNHYVGVQSNDEDVGKLLGILEKRNELDDSIIMLSSDHGFFLGEHGLYDKRLMYEPSIRVPMMIRYPRLIPAGVTSEEMVLNIDAAQTLLEMVGIRAPATMQGRSMLPLAQGKAVADWRKDWLYEYFEYPGYENVRPCRGVRTERYKYIHYFLLPEEFELYDLQEDPDEANNLYGKPGYEALTAKLRNRLEELRRETLDNYHWKPSKIATMSVEFVEPKVEYQVAPGN